MILPPNGHAGGKENNTMTTMIGKKMFIGLTGKELPEALPINHGEAMAGKMYTIMGEVTDEHTQGVWFRLEKLFNADYGEMQMHEVDTYFLPWSAFKRVTLFRDTKAPANIGLYL